MAWTFNITKAERRERTIEYFGSLTFTGNYATGGDGPGTFTWAGGVGGWPEWAPDVSALHADIAPVSGVIHGPAGYTASIIPGSGPTNAKIKIYSAVGTELAAGAYPAAITGATDATLALVYPKLL